MASLVQELTSDPEKIKQMGKAEYLKQKMATMSSYALVIKLADRLDNVRDITTAKTPEWRARYAEETNKILDYIERHRALSGTHKKLIELIREKLKEVAQHNDVKEGDVVKGRFGQKFVPQLGRTVKTSPYERNPDIEIPEYDPVKHRVWHAGVSDPKNKEPFDRFETRRSELGSTTHIIGITKNGERIQISTTTSEELAKVLADAYNRGGFTDVPIEKVSLSPKTDLTEGDRLKQYILYINGRAVTIYDNLKDAQWDAHSIRQTSPKSKLVIKQEICQEQPLDLQLENKNPGEHLSSVQAVLKDFLPFAMKELKIKKLPKLHFKKSLDYHGQPSFGSFNGSSITLAVTGRHPIDVCRTLAHELIHFKQKIKKQLDHNSGETGSPAENQANSLAGIVMRKFSKKYPHHMK